MSFLREEEFWVGNIAFMIVELLIGTVDCHLDKEEYADNVSKIELIDEQIAKLKKLAIDIKAYCLNNFYNEERKSFVRNKSIILFLSSFFSMS